MLLFRRITAIVFVSFLFVSIAKADEKQALSTVVQADEIQWGYLNPLRGDKSPAAADLWGDRSKNQATGMLVKFNKGFSSPPHIHNISYRGIVIDGFMHNDDPKAATTWMPVGSFWTQPAGENHITAADGQSNMIYLEIDSGPYLVKPTTEQFDSGERAINLDNSNLVWLSHEDVNFVNVNGVEITPLWGSTKPDELGGMLVKLPAGFKGAITSTGNEFRAVVIKGQVTYQSAEVFQSKKLSPGSYFSSSAAFMHQIGSHEEALVYIRSNGGYSFSLH